MVLSLLILASPQPRAEPHFGFPGALGLSRDKLDLWVASPSDRPLAERKLPSHVCVYVIRSVVSDSL